MFFKERYGESIFAKDAFFKFYLWAKFVIWGYFILAKLKRLLFFCFVGKIASLGFS
jgi:hypothetical protein